MKLLIKFARTSLFQLQLCKLQIYRACRSHEKSTKPISLTVCIPAYKSEFIKETLESLKNQPLKGFKVLISIDGNDQETLLECAKHSNELDTICFLQKSQLGWVKNTNWLLEHATTDYISILPHDDLLHPFYLEELFRKISQDKNCSLVFCDTRLFSDDNKMYGRYFLNNSLKGNKLHRMKKYLLKYNNAIGFRSIFRKTTLKKTGIIQENDFKNFASDTNWLAKFTIEGNLIRVPYVLCAKRFHKNNTHIDWSKERLDTQKKAWEDHCKKLLTEFSLHAKNEKEKSILQKAYEARISKGNPARLQSKSR